MLVELGDITLNNEGYYGFYDNKEYQSAVYGKSVVANFIHYYADMSPFAAFSAISNYIIGSPNMTIKKLQLKVWLM